ncbi:conserved hypothetical protein [Sporisorium reilianum SRZ2]|uniref:Uncharacterized protein n=1 Tax=Sporisorium reilianum (strain SRZ2) TaxID=999809 RepID=E6ZNF9_SPORE|nr:conserved hypothetical protein [Sporisorium reilianum SRZ2]
MEETLAFVCGGCCAAIAAQLQYAFCNTRQYGTDATCCDNCCRFNCCWKQGALPVEDYPVANSAVEEQGGLPKYEATPPMQVGAPSAERGEGGGTTGGQAPT